MEIALIISGVVIYSAFCVKIGYNLCEGKQAKGNLNAKRKADKIRKRYNSNKPK